jgi:diaminopimelate epimerase
MTTQVLLDSTTYGVPSGNYDGSSEDWAGNGVTAANYYRGRGGLQTISITVTNFEGVLHVEATLDSNADTATWFETFEFGDGSTSPVTDYRVITVTGNFTWMRARVTAFSGGTIDQVTMTY